MLAAEAEAVVGRNLPPRLVCAAAGERLDAGMRSVTSTTSSSSSITTTSDGSGGVRIRSLAPCDANDASGAGMVGPALAHPVRGEGCGAAHGRGGVPGRVGRSDRALATLERGPSAGAVGCGAADGTGGVFGRGRCVDDSFGALVCTPEESDARSSPCSHCPGVAPSLPTLEN